MTDLLCMSLPNFAENVAEKAEAVREDEDLDLRAVIGTPVNFREFDDLQEQHEFGEGEPSMLTRDLNASEEDGVVRVGGYGYPSWAFAADATDVLDKADRQLFGTTLFDATDLNTPHHAAMTLEQYASLVHDLAEHYGDDYAVITGTMSPNGTWQITDGGSLKRVGMLNFPDRCSPRAASPTSRTDEHRGPARRSSPLMRSLTTCARVASRSAASPTRRA